MVWIQHSVLGSLLTKIINNQDGNIIPIYAFVDNKLLVQNVSSTTLVTEKRLRIDLAAIQQSVEKK